jgi:hypothetical protein
MQWSNEKEEIDKQWSTKHYLENWELHEPHNNMGLNSHAQKG